jgi:acyl-coenzyme A synthetase/AMP-(fatty) acid ligase
MLQSDGSSLWNLLSAAGRLSERFLWAAQAEVALGDLLRGSCLDGKLESLRGRHVLIATKDQLPTALALIELDGIARRVIVCPPDFRAEYFSAVRAVAEIDALVSDRSEPEFAPTDLECFVRCSPSLKTVEPDRTSNHRTEWVLLTSGTTGAPKMVLHTLSSLTGAIRCGSKEPGRGAVWGTFYDIRRYGGLQIFLRALLDGGSLVLSSAAESTEDFLARAGSHKVSHISGTPSHWRRALMSPCAHKIAPDYVRLSGEVADQAILDALREFYPGAKVAHAFASTEAGVAFAVDDGLAGFPAGLAGRSGADVEIKIEDGSLRIRSARTATRYLEERDGKIADHDGFVDTRDMVELRSNRYYFVGRRDGVINVGGLKVYPEEIEAVINRHPMVRMSLVKSRKNAITGAIVVAEVVLDTIPANGAAPGQDILKKEILEACRSALAPFKVPASIRFVPSLDVAESGKMARL